MNKIKLNFIINKKLFIDDFDIKDFKKNIKFIILRIIKDNGIVIKNINYNYCSIPEIRYYNKKYLSHDYETDILTFGYKDDELTESDIMISVETVRKNSVRFKTSFSDEIYRVSIHGILHLCGYNDSSASEKNVMRKKENYYLNILKREFING